MSIVVWKYKNVYSENKYNKERLFIFKDKNILLQQELTDDININNNTGSRLL